MTPIVLRTSTERLVRTLALMVLIDVFTVLYFWDGYVGYARKNAAELSNLVGLEAAKSLTSNPRVTAELAARISRQLEAAHSADDLLKSLGEPAVRQEAERYYLGPGGWLRVFDANGRITAEWTDGPHTESDQRWQRIIGYILAVFGLAAMVRFALVVGTRAELTDDGLRLQGRPLIPWEAITALRKDSGGRAGCVELEIQAQGATQVIRMDDYAYRNLSTLIQKLCERKGFANPWP